MSSPDVPSSQPPPPSDPAAESWQPQSGYLPGKKSYRAPRRQPTAERSTDVFSDSETTDPIPGVSGSSSFLRRPESRVQADLAGLQKVRGSHIGDQYVRVIRNTSEEFDSAGAGHLIATEESLRAEGRMGQGYARIKRTLIGAPLATAQAAHERLTNAKALAVLSSDALSSVAYATEEILRVLLVTAGIAAMVKVLPIGAAIVTLLLIVGISYRQTIRAYPQGGGAYSVAKDNLGELPSLTAAAALLIGYVLTVSVSIAAAVSAMVSAEPALQDHRILLGIALIILVTVLNLRGVREAGTIFAIPTYLFLVGIFAMLGIGMVRQAIDGFPRTAPPPAAEELAGVGALTTFVLLRAFSSGGAALTGVEAISNGVPVFQPVEWRNARKTLTIMIVILAITFSGITFLAYQFGTYPMETSAEGYQTVVSQIAMQVFGGKNAAFYFIQFATTAILVLAANTAYADFPRLAYVVAKDNYLPRQLTFRGDRLSFSTGILSLGVLGAIVLIIFRGETERIIPLYAIGVFLSFTLSQAGMSKRWIQRKEPGWKFGFPINLVGAIATGLVAIIAGITKFTEGAWIVLVIIPIMVATMLRIHRHYEESARELAELTPLDPDSIHHTVVVPIANLNRVARQTLAYAASMSDNVVAVHITDDEESIETMKREWADLNLEIPLVIIESPYRALVGPFLHYLEEISAQRPGDTITVVLPEYIARRRWELLLHNQTALRLKAALLFRPGIVVTSVPYHLERSRRMDDL